MRLPVRLRVGKNAFKPLRFEGDLMRKGARVVVSQQRQRLHGGPDVSFDGFDALDEPDFGVGSDGR